MGILSKMQKVAKRDKRNAQRQARRTAEAKQAATEETPAYVSGQTPAKRHVLGGTEDNSTVEVKKVEPLAAPKKKHVIDTQADRAGITIKKGGADPSTAPGYCPPDIADKSDDHPEAADTAFFAPDSGDE